MADRRLRVGLIGRGAIGSVIAQRLRDGAIDGVELAGVLRREPSAPDEVASVAQLLSLRCDVVVEAAGAAVVAAVGPSILRGGVDLVVLSAGSLADRSVERSLRDAGPGRLLLSTGAIGGLDIARALAERGSIRSVAVTSTTTPNAIPAPAPLTADDGPYRVFIGSAREAALAHPTITNVAATTALATVGLDAARVELWVDPAGAEKRHVVEIDAGDGTVRIEVTNAISASNPRTSAVTPYAVLRLLRDRVEPMAAGV